MKILSTTSGPFLRFLDAKGIYTEVIPYDDVYHTLPESDLFDALLVDISDGKAEGVYTPRSLISKGHTLPIIGVLNEQEVTDERDFERLQAIFIVQGGLYLLKQSSSPDLFQACVSQATTLNSQRSSHFVPVREFSSRGAVLKIDFRLQKVTIDNLYVHLTRHEYMLLELLALRTGLIVSKDSILGHLYSGYEMPDIRIVDVFICKIRKKLGDVGVLLETAWGRGYTLRESIKENRVSA